VVDFEAGHGRPGDVNGHPAVHVQRALQRIFEAFDGEVGEEVGEDGDEDGNAMAVVTSQLRYFVIQVS